MQSLIDALRCHDATYSEGEFGTYAFDVFTRYIYDAISADNPR